MAQAAPSNDPAEVEVELRRARNEYAYGNYEQAAEQLRDLLYPMRLYNDEQVIETRKYLALSYYLLGKLNAATEEFGKLLYLAPDYHLDPYTVPPPIIELFDIVRTKMKPELDGIRQRKSDEELASQAAAGYVRHIEQTMLERSELVTLLPFGIGQFQNGDYGWGTLFAISELALLAINIGAYASAQSYGPAYEDSEVRDRIHLLTVVQYGALAVFGVVWSIGAYQARMSFQPIVAGPRVVHDEPVVKPAGGLLQLRLDF